MTVARQPSFALVPFAAHHESGLKRLQSRQEVRDRLGRVAQTDSEVRSGVLATETDGAFAGVVGLVRSRALEANDVELVCALLEEYEGCGLATSACRQLLHGEAHAGKRSRVLASIASDNSDGKALAQRLGFARIGTRVLSSDELWELPLSSLVAPAV